MTEKRFIPIFDGTDKRVVGAKNNGKIISFMDMFDLLNNLSEENEQLKKILNELSDMLQFDVENGIRSYPVKLSEYLSNALKELQKND